MNATSLPFALIASSNASKTFSKQSPFKSTGFSYIVLDFTHPCHIVNIVFRNAGSAFVTVLAGDSVQAKRLRRSLNRKAHFEVFDEMKTLIAETQVISYEQFKTGQRLERVKTFRQFNRFINRLSTVFSCLAILVRPFVDAVDQSVGIGFVECYGEVRAEDATSVADGQTKVEEIKTTPLKRTATQFNSITQQQSALKKAKT